jgi:hypothetical protein
MLGSDSIWNFEIETMGFGPAPDVPRLYFEYVTFFIDSIPVLISFGGLDLHGFIAEGADRESRKFCHVSVQCEHQIAQETDARTGHGGRMCKAIHQSYACIASVTVHDRTQHLIGKVKSWDRKRRLEPVQSACDSILFEVMPPNGLVRKDVV